MHRSSAARAIVVVALAALLVGCSYEQKLAQAAQARAEVAEAVAVYTDQLVRSGEPHAVLSAQPRAIDDVAMWSPYRLLEIDGKKLEGAPYSFTRARPLPRDYAFSELKVPAGIHDLTISGGGVRAYFTKFSKVNFEAGKRYAIFEGLAADETITVFISEYRQDGKRISDAVERGTSTVVEPLAAKP